MTQHERPTPEEWFHDHYSNAAGQIIDFLAEDGIVLDGKCVADIGCGEGTIALGLTHGADITQFHGYDLRPTSPEHLSHLARTAGVRDDVPACLSFHPSYPAEIPCEPDAFDVVVSWSTLEHVADPVSLLSEVRRILRPDGIFFLQVWPLFPSEHGGHLWLTGANEPYAHLRRPYAEVADQIANDEGTYPGFSAVDEWASLNRMCLDDLQRALLAARLIPTKVELITSSAHLTRDLMRHRLSDLMIGGVKMLAVPWGVVPPP